MSTITKTTETTTRWAALAWLLLLTAAITAVFWLVRHTVETGSPWLLIVTATVLLATGVTLALRKGED